MPTNFPDELNLARYVDLLRRRWLLIVVCAVLGTVAAYFYASLQPKMYTTEAQVAVVRTGTIVSFDSKIRTVSDTDPTAQSADAVWRRPSLLAIGESEELAQQVISKIGTQLPDTLRDPTLLASHVTITNNGDLFSIHATAETPDLAALIANEWAAVYAARVNELFSERPESLELIKGQVAQARSEYDTQQTALVTYMQANPIEVLKREQASIIIELDNQVNVETKLTQLAADVTALRTRLQTAGATVSSADELTQILIQATAFNNGSTASTAPLRLDLSQNTPTATTTQQLAQLDALSQAIEQRRTAMTAEKKQALNNELNSVQAQLEQAQQKLKELQAARDLAWDTYQTLNTKVSEVIVTAGSQNQLVRVAAAAFPPSAPIAARGFMNAVIGGALGLIVGVLLAVGLDFQRARMQVAAVPSHKPAPQ